MQKICVILGAGASHDVRNENSTLIDRRFQPPLTDGLFDFADRAGVQGYWDIVEGYAGAEALGTVIGARIARRANSVEPDVSLESVLTEYAERPEPLIEQQLKHVPPYLRDLLHYCSTNYVQTPGTYLDLVYTLLSGDHRHQVLFLILNYDTLLEQALTARDASMTFTNMDSYVNSERAALVVKLHGSINWYYELPASEAPIPASWDDGVQKLPLKYRPPDRDIFIVENIQNLRRRRRALYPVMTAPLARKDPDSFTCPATHVGAAKEFLKDCRKFLVAGTSGLDLDIRELLRDNVQARSHIHFVGLGGSTDKAFWEYKRHIKEFAQVRVSVDNRAFPDGFASYVASPEFQSFAGLWV